MNTHKATLLVVLAVAGWVAGAARAQSPSHPDARSPLKSNPYLSHHDPWRWDLILQIFLRGGSVAYIDTDRVEEGSVYFDLDRFEFILPVMREGGFFWAPDHEVQTTVRIDSSRDRSYLSSFIISQNEAKIDPKILRAPRSGALYSRIKEEVDLGAIQSMHFKQRNRLVSADTRFDERRAREIPWPDRWPDEAARHLTPVIERVRDPIDLVGQDRLCELVDQWTRGQDPRSIDQVTLVKYLTAKVLDTVRIGRGKSRSRPSLQTRTLLRLSEDGEIPIPRGVWSGLAVRSADLIALRPERGSVFDDSVMLTAALRAAGVPARTVACYDTADEAQPLDRIVTIVEFALYDQQRDQILWVPIDTERLRDNGRGVSSYEQPWLYFGTHDELHELVPIAQHFHPPVDYRSFGFPSFYGFRSEPQLERFTIQHLAIDALVTPVSGEDFKDD